MRRRLAAVALAGLLPWAVAVYPDGAYAVFSFGLLGRGGFAPLPTVLLGAGPVRQSVLMWPAAVGCWLAALLAVVARARPAVSAALCALAAVAVFRLSLWLGSRADYLVFPVGAVLFGGVAVAIYAE